MSRTPALAWDYILGQAAAIVTESEVMMTLRQLFYRLVSERSTQHPDRLQGSFRPHRRGAADRWFPELIDRGRSIHRHRRSPAPTERDWLA